MANWQECESSRFFPVPLHLSAHGLLTTWSRPKAEESVRNALNSLGVRSPAETTGVGISHPVESLVADPGFPTTVNRPTSPSLDTVASYTVRASGLDTLQTLLSHGDRPNALKFALDQRMWAHALVIANSLGNDTWRDTVREFVRFELGNPTVLGKAASEHNTSNGRESLRTLYSLFAGAGASASKQCVLVNTNSVFYLG